MWVIEKARKTLRFHSKKTKNFSWNVFFWYNLSLNTDVAGFLHLYNFSSDLF